MNDKQKREFYLQYQNALGLKPGDKVKITEKFPDRTAGWKNDWTSDMDEEIGKVRTVNSLVGNEGVRFEESYYSFPAYVLEKLPGNTLAESDEAFRRTVAKLVMVDPVAAKKLLNMPESELIYQFAQEDDYILPFKTHIRDTPEGWDYWGDVVKRFREANDDGK